MMEFSWKRMVVGPEVTIDDALKVIDAAGMRIALVVDAHERLLGTLSDGDVRRALIARVPLSERVGRAMNCQPLVADESVSRESVSLLMEQNDVLVMPVVDGDGKLVDVYNFKELLEPQCRDNLVFLMAGGLGTRLRPLTTNTPKPMLKLGDKPILEKTLESFIAAGFRHFVISVYYRAEVIKSYFGNGEKWGVDIRYVEESTPLGTAGALGLLSDVRDLPVIMMNGDLVTRVDFRALLAFHGRSGSALTMCVRECDVQVPFGVVETSGHKVVAVTEKPVHTFLVNAGIYVLSPKIIAEVPKNVKMDMPDLVRTLLVAERDVGIFPLHEYWLDIGRFDDFTRAVTNPADNG
jgi:UDP-2,4-diacetamido-2,4,6-trideoxy-beta-L-gulopyranose hydrolase